jgi:NAD(P)-dependent dehydrogenase (short-subunit alcohol dehydrogenase family)
VPDPLDPRPLFDLAGRAIVVTGGSGGLGSATAQGLAACGAYVVVVGRASDRVHEVTSRITDTGGRAVGVVADITRPADRESVVDAALTAYGRLDVLINNAGVTHRVSADSVTVETYRRVHGINAEAALFLSQAAHPHLRDSGHGSIVNVVSTGLWTSGPKSLLYRSSKASLHAMTMVLAQEWAPDGIRVNAVAPGAFEAGMGADLDAERIASHLARTPQQRRGRPGEIVPTMLYLASDASSFVTGTTLRVDGGAVSV